MFRLTKNGIEIGFSFEAYNIFILIVPRQDINSTFIPNNPVTYGTSCDISIYKQFKDPFNNRQGKEYLCFCDNKDTIVLNVDAQELVTWIDRVAKENEFITFNTSVVFYE